MKKTGYERNKTNDIYYSIDIADNVFKNFDLHDIVHDDIYSIANYYIDKTVAINNARADKLMRQLRRFAVENNDDKIETNSDTKMLIINDSIVVPIQPQSSRIIVLDTNEE